jgi:hypothetical protein
LNMKRILFLIMLISFGSMLLTQEINYQVEKPQQVYIGTPINLFVELIMEPTDSVYSHIADSLDVFLLQGEIFQTEEIIDNKKKIHQKITYQPFNTGEYTFPQLEYAVKTNSGTKILTTSEFQVNVESSIPDSAQVIKDIAEPIRINLRFWDFFIPILIIIFIIIIIKYLRKYLKSDKGSDKVSIPEDTRPAWQIAMEKLEQLQISGILEKGEFINYHYGLSLVLRYFLELEYNLKAVEMTTKEIRSQLILEDPSEKSNILNFLSQADMIKFAKSPVDLAGSKQSYEWLREYLLQYKLRTERHNGEGENV